jgi:hypothetical protein
MAGHGGKSMPSFTLMVGAMILRVTGRTADVDWSDVAALVNGRRELAAARYVQPALISAFGLATLTLAGMGIAAWVLSEFVAFGFFATLRALFTGMALATGVLTMAVGRRRMRERRDGMGPSWNLSFVVAVIVGSGFAIGLLARDGILT